MRRLSFLAAVLMGMMLPSVSSAQVEQICANTNVPAGWIKVNDFNDVTRCGRPISFQVLNIWVIERFSNKPVGATMAACNEPAAPTPPDWIVKTTFNDVLRCGHPINFDALNVKLIERVNGPTPSPTPPPPPAPQFQGTLDEASCDFIKGWAWNALTPNSPLRVDLLADGALLAQVTADQFRADLLAAGKGDGRHAFDFQVPASLKNNRNRVISARVSGTNFVLASSPRTIRCANPIDDARFFVRQHYRDFLARDPDAGGWNFWTSNITQCGTDPACIDHMRVQVSKAFFLSIEFQQTGYYVHRFYKASFGRLPNITEFAADKNLVSQNVIVGSPGWENVLETNKQGFAGTWVGRGAFVSIYGGLSNQEFIDRLFANAQVTPEASFRNDLLDGLNSGRYSRAIAMKRLVEYERFAQAEFNSAFVLMQYFGYLRRNPNDPPDSDFSGYLFWLSKLNAQGDQNEMVKAFIVSQEYRNRFGRNDGAASALASRPPAVVNPPPPCGDQDGDGYCDDLDCNPSDPSVHPGASTYCGWGEDRDCSGTDDFFECFGW